MALLTFLTAACCFGQELPSGLSPSDTQTEKEIHTIITEQLAALRSGNFVRAYAFSCRPFQERTSLRQFVAIIRESYRPMLQPASVEFLQVQDDGNEAIAEIRLQSPKAGGVYYRYFFIREADAWRVSGVLPIQPPGIVV